jgi:acyl-CoA synthetase (AMP-forming)/AMP-acid ligase II
MTVLDLLAGRDSETALIEPDAGRRVSFGELRGEVHELAAKLAGAGVARGDTIALILPDGPLFVRFLLATTALGAAAAPLNPAYTTEEFRFYLEDLAPRFVLTTTGDAAAARRAADDEGRLLDVDGDDFAAVRASDYETAQPDDVAIVLHTSGTTSPPKQVPLLHRNLVASARGIPSSTS